MEWAILIRNNWWRSNKLKEKKLRVAICDDEKVCASELMRKLREQGYEFEVVYFCSGEDFLDSDLEFFIVFLDIEMNGMNGFMVAEQLQRKSFSGKVILTTYHVDNFTEAFRFGVFRYLVKPIQSDRLQEAVEAVEKSVKKNEHLLLTYGGKTNAVKMGEIVCICASKDESIFFDMHKYGAYRFEKKHTHISFSSSVIFFLHIIVISLIRKTHPSSHLMTLYCIFSFFSTHIDIMILKFPTMCVIMKR